MAHDAHVRAKARELRIERGMALDEISERLALPRTTVFYWLRDLPAIDRKGRPNSGQRIGSLRMQAKYAAIREQAYERGLIEFDALTEEPTFRDFVCMYIGEGYKRDRNAVALCNSDPAVVRLGSHWICHLGTNRIHYALQYHADQDLDDLRGYWGRFLSIPPQSVATQRKSNSNQLTGRTWRSRHGVLTVRTGDTVLRARLEGWMMRLRVEWDEAATLAATPGA